MSTPVLLVLFSLQVYSLCSWLGFWSCLASRLSSPFGIPLDLVIVARVLVVVVVAGGLCLVYFTQLERWT